MDQANSNLGMDLGDLYQKVVETTGEGIVCVKADGFIGFSNEAFCRLVGYDNLTELYNTKLADLLTPESLANYRARAEKRKAGQLREQYELVYQNKKTGKLVYSLSCVSPILSKNGDLLFSMEVVTNITPLKELQSELGKTIHRLKKAQNVARLGFWEHDLDSNEYWWSDELFAMFGMRPTEVGLTDGQLVAMVHPQDMSKLLELKDAAYQLGIPYSTRYRAIKTDGSTIVVHSVADIEKDKDGRVVRLLGICQDVTDDAERDSIIQGQRTQIIATSKLSALGEMTGGVAHEIIAPLAVIQNRAEGLRKNLTKSDWNKESAAAALEVVIQSTTKISNVMSGLRAFSRQSDGDPVAPTSVQAVVENSLTFCREKFKNHGVHIEVAPIHPHLMINCQPTQVARVLLNLLNNSFDAVEKLKVSWVRVEAREDKDYVEICIVDSGTGIPKVHADRIFQPFFTTKDAGKGAGLGLSTSRGLMEVQNGSLTFDSSRPNTCFVMRLPKVKVATAAAAA